MDGDVRINPYLAGNFAPVRSEKLEDHPMHTERFHVPGATLRAIRDTRARGGRVIPIGTTTVRALESAATFGVDGGVTELFIRPGYEWKLVDVLFTNFHQPRSSLLVMLSAFAGPRWREIYAEALADEYRFLSFGDAMMVGRGDDR